MVPKRTRPTASAPHAPSTAEEKPWSGEELCEASMLFGTLAAGILAAINLRRLGRPELSGTCVFFALALSVGVAVITCAMPVKAFVLVVPLCFFAVSVGFDRAQKPELKKWMERHVPEEQRASYKGDGAYLPIGLLCLAVQFGGTFLLYRATHG